MKLTLRPLINAVKAAVGVTTMPASAISSGSWWGTVSEGFAGAWQRNVELESKERQLSFGAVYACLNLISGDISKLRIKLVEYIPGSAGGGIWVETTNSSFSPVLRKPNRYQTRIQFLSYWVLSKLIFGNTYVLKERDGRNIVTALYILDPRRVKVLVAKDGAVYYELQADDLSGIVSEGATFPASEIIHDRGMCPFHPLVGVGPIYAAALSSTQGIKIQNNSSKFFENMSRPSGHLTADGEIPDETAARIKAEFETKFSGSNLGRLFVSGSGLKYEPMTIPAQQAQMIEQLKWTGEECCRPFGVPLYKVGLGPIPSVNNTAQLNQEYYSTCLQTLVESIELLLDEGLNLPPGLGTELDLDGLLRMDPQTMMTTQAEGTKAGICAPDEARQKLNLPPVPGGKYPFLQQQYYSLEELSKRPVDSLANPPAPPLAAAPAPAPEPGDDPDDAAEKAAHAQMREFLETIQKGLEHV